MSSQDARLKRIEQALLAQHEQNTIKLPKLQSGFWCGHYLDKQGVPIPDKALCCFWHWRGLPRRWGQRHPIYTWQSNLLADVEKGYSRFAIFKPPKIGATEFVLTYFIYKALFDPSWANGQVGILVGTNQGESELMIERAKNILAERDDTDRPLRDERGGITYRFPINQSYNNKKTFSVNTVKFMAHPANHYDAIRAKPNMKAILGDEIAFFVKKKEDQQPIRDAFEHYAVGAKPLVFLITTSGEAPAGFAYDIYQEPDIEHGGFYRKHILWPEAGLEIHPESKTSLFDHKELEALKNTPSYKRNFLHQWGYDAGNIWTPEQIDAAVKDYDYAGLQNTLHVMGIDWGFGSSKFAFVVARLLDNRIQIVYAQEFERPDFNAMARHAAELITKYHIPKTYVDGSNPAWITTLKGMVQERPDFDKAIDEYKKQGMDYQTIMKVVPVYFNQENVDMVDHSRQLLSDGKVDIHPDFKGLIQQMRAAKMKETGKLDKDISSLDIIDSLFLCLKGFAYRRAKR